MRNISEDVDLPLVVGDALDDADGEAAEGGEFVFDSGEALVRGVEAPLDVPVLGVESVMDGVGGRQDDG